MGFVCFCFFILSKSTEAKICHLKPFPACNSWTLRTFMSLCNCHHHPSAKQKLPAEHCLCIPALSCETTILPAISTKLTVLVTSDKGHHAENAVCLFFKQNRVCYINCKHLKCPFIHSFETERVTIHWLPAKCLL